MASYVEITITDPAAPPATITSYWFIYALTLDYVLDKGEFYWGVYTGLIGAEPDPTTQLLDPSRVGIDDTGYNDPETNTFVLSVDWINIIQAVEPDPDRTSVFNYASVQTYKFNNEIVDLSTGVIH